MGPQSRSFPNTEARTSGRVRVDRAGIVYVTSGPVAPFPSWPRNLSTTLPGSEPVFVMERSVVQKALFPEVLAEDGNSHAPTYVVGTAVIVTVALADPPGPVTVSL